MGSDLPCGGGSAWCLAARREWANLRFLKSSSAPIGPTPDASCLADGDGFLDIAAASPREVIRARRHIMGYVSQFLRVIPRVAALDIVAAAAREAGLEAEAARGRAVSLLTRLNLPERLWPLPPATFSGGEQQRVNLARGFAGDHALLILDEPTASLDAENRNAVVELIAERRAGGAGFLAIFHDEDVRARLADRLIDVTAFSSQEAA